jgi:dihydrodipicolinate reductase
MTKVIMHGCNGKMGQVITQIISEMPNLEIVAGIDVYMGIKNTYPVFPALKDCKIDADVIIDFSNPLLIDELLKQAITRKLPIVLCTTGLSEDQLNEVKKASEEIAILKSANMSLGVNLLLKLLKEATRTLIPAGFDIEIVEKHHKRKIDAPSGTALAMADSINEALDNEYTYKYDRSQERQARAKKEIGIQAVRGGTIVGEHEVIFAGEDEVITFEHTAYSKAIFAKGSIEAAKFLAGKPSGLYDMSQVIQMQ